MKKSRPTVFAIALLASTWASPVAAELAPRLVEYIAGVGQSPDAGDTAAGLSPLRSETLEEILANPSAVDVRIGQASLEAMRSARALSLVLPRSTVSGPELLASFDDLEITERSEHDYSVYGVNESAKSEVSLVVLGEDVVGTIRFEGEVYELRPLGGGLTAVYRRDTSQWDGAECGVTDHPRLSVPRNRDNGAGVAPGARPQAAAQPDPRAPAAPGDGGEVIDVLVAYTRGARSAAGNIDALIRHFFDDTNRFFSNSRIRTRVRLTHGYQTEYTQSSKLGIDLERLRVPDDGRMDEAHDLREQYGADFVALLIARRSDFCGRADLYFAWESQAFSVSAQDCGSDTFAHELGHNFGAHHDPDTDTNTGFPYGHGLCHARGPWRTIMSYNYRRRCSPRAPHFSNPDVSYRGTRTGDAHTRNNARVIDETAQHIARFRRAFLPRHSIPLVMSADNSAQQGFLRIINRSDRSGRVRIDAFDDRGVRFAPTYLSLHAWQTRHFNSTDLERGNTSKGLSRGIGNGSGNWRLDLTTDLDIKARAYIRTSDGFLTSIHEVAAEEDGGPMRYRVPTLNPGKNRDQRSRLRLINRGNDSARIEISGLDDRGEPPGGGSVRLSLRAGASRMLTAGELEQGAEGLSGRFGAGSGKWQLSVSADQPLEVMSLLFSRTGNVTNLSR